MPRKPAPLEQKGGKSPRQHIWEAIRTHRKAFTREMLAEHCNGIPRVSLTILLRGLGAYGTGRCSTARYERLYRQTFEAITCPFNGRPVDIEYCREKALQAAPTHNPQKLNHWKACQECQFKPAAPKEPNKRRGRVEIPITALDTKTLPLPVVGGPQIDLTIKERSE
ncbi:MarR family transcriptional regulator [Ralstonia mannitolilytica]|uniref:MarR family transcriptional regulator n=1 Tax=Ralstonia mannitolilytica TaxID=105219 RepID=UPI0028F5BB1D|nr:MarR family transcriptional regulator [Ralstonia mannitolilytica]CAJ0858431.1 hypothetical protein R76727_01256 [Ralstonia mannitolilytica]